MINAASRLLTKYSRAEWLIPAALCLVLLVQVFCSVRQMSQQADEATHLYAGYRALKCGDFTFGREHPPLAKMLVAIPLLWSNPPVDCTRDTVATEEEQSTNWLYSREDWWQVLMKARAVSSLFAAALCLGVWVVARCMFGRAVATISAAVLAFEPNILGHGALLLNNVLLSTLFLLTVFSFYLWTRRRTLPLLLATGLFMGLALLTKSPAVLLMPMLILLALGEARLERSDWKEALGRAWRNVPSLAVIGLVAIATIWCGYGLHHSGGTREFEEPPSSVFSAEVQVLKAMRAVHVLPRDYLDGLIEVRAMVTDGEDSIDLLGRPYTGSPWFFFPLAAIIKFTLPLLAMLVMGGVGVLAMGKERLRETLFLLLPALLYLVSSMCIRRTAIGIWHLFPMLPFLLIAAVAGCVNLARRCRWAGGVLVCLLALHAVSSLRAYPNYLSYANEAWGGSQNVYKHLPWTDLNQTYWEVSRYMEQHPDTPCWVSSDWLVPVSKYKVPCAQMGNNWETELPLRMKGIVFVSSSWLRSYGHEGEPLSPFSNVEPTARLGGSAMLVYEGEFDTHLAAARAIDNKALRLMRAGSYSTALPLTEEAVEVAPTSFEARDLYCVALANNGYPQEALMQCTVALRLSKARPLGLRAVREITRHLEVISQLSGVPLPPVTQ
jgi:hypothetical protein